MARNKGWFKTDQQDGDRTIEQQLVGLDLLFSMVAGKTVLDVGCAEGLIGTELMHCGAASVHGVDVIVPHISYARTMALPGMSYEVANADRYSPTKKYDVVLLLAILHKLKGPAAAAERLSKVAPAAVVRLPPTGPVVVDSRSDNEPQDILAAMKRAGMELVLETRGTFDEWIGYFARDPAYWAQAADTTEKAAEVERVDNVEHAQQPSAASHDADAEPAAVGVQAAETEPAGHVAEAARPSAKPHVEANLENRTPEKVDAKGRAAKPAAKAAAKTPAKAAKKAARR